VETSKPKPRRKRRCAREGCKRGVRDEYRCYSYLCNVVTDRTESAAHGADNGVRWSQAGKRPRGQTCEEGRPDRRPSLDVCLNQWCTVVSTCGAVACG
jgi:hypothetical protein